MKTRKILRKIIYSSWFLAVIPAIIVMLLLPPLGSRYKLEITQPVKNGGSVFYTDLNSDSISEYVVTAKGGPYYFLAVWSQNHQIYDQWNFHDTLCPEISQPFFGNYDHDRSDEIYLFSHSGDSLFLNVDEALQPSGLRMKGIFITRVGYWKGDIAAVTCPAGFYDVNKDGFDELYFSISSFYQLGERRMYCFDLVNRKLTSGPLCGNIIIEPVMADADGDGTPEIFGYMSGSGNYSSRVQYSDSSTWLMVYDPKLQFKFPPVEFKGFANGLEVYPYKNERFRGYVLLHLANGTDSTVMESSVMIYDRSGHLVVKRPQHDFIKSRSAFVFVSQARGADRIYIVGDEIYEMNGNLEILRTLPTPFKKITIARKADINGDKKDEFLLYSEAEKRIVVYSSDFHKLSEASFDPPTVAWRLSAFYSTAHQYSLFLGSGTEGYLLKLVRIKFYLARYFIHPSVYLAFFFFIILIKKIGTTQQKAQESLNNRLITLQLQGIKAQLDPHFTFNTLNSIASLIYLEDRQAAYDYMRKFTELLRSMLNDAEKIYRNLGDEIDFVTTYLELEKLRFGNKFTYQIDIGEEVNLKIQVPKLVLQTFAENAVKHGIMSADSGGLIKIRIVREKDYLKLSVEDNGIGRENSAGQSNSTGKGLKLTSEFYDILNQINKKPIRHLITDLYDNESHPCGTRVEVWVPADEFSDQFRN